MLRKVNRKCICYVQCSYATVRIYVAGHTAAAVRYDNGVPVTVYRVRQSLPKLLERFVILGDCIPSRVAVLMDNLVREERACVNLGFALGEAFQISTTAIFVIPEKCLVVDQVCARRNCFILDLVPLFGGHLLLDYIEITA